MYGLRLTFIVTVMGLGRIYSCKNSQPLHDYIPHRVINGKKLPTKSRPKIGKKKPQMGKKKLSLNKSFSGKKHMVEKIKRQK